ncbi:LuxR C-terminal-related transcriptional regulator [Caenispirillum salinarum]|uniref:LuxR C-terminal-related transcriptional regulator n=1 Tax=Caenispirillum salinarum TaxID=859058 RepID=UPI00384DBD1F
MQAPVLVFSKDPALNEAVESAALALQRPTVVEPENPTAVLNEMEIMCLLIDAETDIGHVTELMRRSRQARFEADIILAGCADDLSQILSFMRLGASDFLPKPLDIRELKAALDRASFRRSVLVEPVQHVVRELTRGHELTPRESDVLACLLSGLSTKMAAKNLSISPRTVEVHRGRLAKKLNLRGVNELLPRLVKEVSRIVAASRL